MTMTMIFLRALQDLRGSDYIRTPSRARRSIHPPSVFVKAPSLKLVRFRLKGFPIQTNQMSGLTSDKRDIYGVYPITGKILNARKASPAQINRNKFIQDLKKILKLEFGKEYTNTSSLRCGRVMIMTDQDDDGTHMSGLLINLFSFLWPSLLKLPSSFLIDFVTPLIKATHESKEPETFYSVRELKEWEEKEKGHKTEWSLKFYKVCFPLKIKH